MTGVTLESELSLILILACLLGATLVPVGATSGAPPAAGAEGRADAPTTVPGASGGTAAAIASDGTAAAIASDGTAVATASQGAAAVTASQSAAAANDSDGTVVRSVSYDGVGVVRRDQNVTYLFADEPHALEVEFTTVEEASTVQICVTAQQSGERNGEADGEGAEAARVENCSTVNGLDEGPNHTAHIGFERWPGNWTGESTVTVEVAANATGSDAADRTNVTAYALNRDEDFSGNGLTNAEELAYGTDFRRSDTDGDGLTDGDEVITYGTDPLDRDTSGNGVPDGMEVLLGTDPTNWWTPHVFLFVFALLIGAGLAAITYRIAPLPDAPAAAGDGRRTMPATTDEAAPDPVITDEERIHRLLEERGGRVRQQDIVEETGWSKSKVSRLLSRMEEEGQLSRVRIGRENIVTTDDAVEVPTDDGN